MLARTLALAAALALAVAAPAAALVTGTGAYTIAEVDVQNAAFGEGDLPFGVNDTVTVSYSYDENFTPTPVMGTVTGLDYTGAVSAFSIMIESTETTEISYSLLSGAVSLSTTDDEPTGFSVVQDGVFLVAVGLPTVTGPGFPGAPDVFASSAFFSKVSASPTLVDGAPPVGAFSDFDLASVSFTLTGGAIVTLSTLTIIPEPASGLLVGLGLAGLGARRPRRSPA